MSLYMMKFCRHKANEKNEIEQHLMGLRLFPKTSLVSPIHSPVVKNSNFSSGMNMNFHSMLTIKLQLTRLLTYEYIFFLPNQLFIAGHQRQFQHCSFRHKFSPLPTLLNMARALQEYILMALHHCRKLNKFVIYSLLYSFVCYFQIYKKIRRCYLMLFGIDWNCSCHKRGK